MVAISAFPSLLRLCSFLACLLFFTLRIWVELRLVIPVSYCFLIVVLRFNVDDSC